MMTAHAVRQPTLLGHEGPAFDATLAGARRVMLGRDAWIDQLQGFLAGHQTLFAALRDDTRWHGHRRLMYDRMVEVPRLTASLPRDGPGHPVVRAIADALGARYGRTFDSVSLALYRYGRDSVAWHRDKARRDRRHCALVATVSLGESRRFLVRPHGGGPSRAFSAGWGDLLVMGGACQRDWEHCVPKTAAAGPRISLMFRSTADFARF